MEMLRFSAATTADMATECAVRMRDNSRLPAGVCPAQGVARLRLRLVK